MAESVGFQPITLDRTTYGDSTFSETVD